MSNKYLVMFLKTLSNIFLSCLSINNMETVDNFYNEFNQFKSRNVLINNALVTKEEILNDIFKDSNENIEEEDWIKQTIEVKDVSEHLNQLFEQKGEVMNITFTENVLKLL